ncbi:hypothetical protein [Streptomyces cinereospinus]|uniref:Uncharacterized protein n=1 Tax=Streptomyces cinereospinus TaxID=285561 RepID=A0ABV5NBH1_9ACTN
MRIRPELPDRRRHASVELFLFPRDGAAFDRHIEASEVEHGFEQHTAFVFRRPSAAGLESLVTAWRTGAGLLWEGGGYNPQEGPGGSTVLYFVRDPAWSARSRRRFELHCAGDLREFTARIPQETEAVRHAYAAWRSTEHVVSI